MTLPPWTQVIVAQLTAFGLKLLGAVVVWIVSRARATRPPSSSSRFAA